MIAVFRAELLQGLNYEICENHYLFYEFSYVLRLMSGSSENILTTEVTVMDRRGLHLRFASDIVRKCSAFRSEIMVSAQGASKGVPAKSALALMTLAAPCGSKLTVRVSGADAPEALKAMEELFAEVR
jgi:phosphocarrier protein HPr